MCTTIVFGEKASADGSFIVARSADSSSLKAQTLLKNNFYRRIICGFLFAHFSPKTKNHP
jgi:hypothetical protein